MKKRRQHELENESKDNEQKGMKYELNGLEEENEEQ